MDLVHLVFLIVHLFLEELQFLFLSSIIILVTGCIFAMWLGEKITDKGIGNGISLLITVGIVATLTTFLYSKP